MQGCPCCPGATIASRLEARPDIVATPKGKDLIYTIGGLNAPPIGIAIKLQPGLTRWQVGPCRPATVGNRFSDRPDVVIRAPG